jgi:hypothetical protein
MGMFDWFKGEKKQEVVKELRPNYEPHYTEEKPQQVFDRKPEPPIFDSMSSNWQFVVGYIDMRIEKLRKSNDNISLDRDKTLIIRGQIDELKRLKKLPENIQAGRISHPNQ